MPEAIVEVAASNHQTPRGRVLAMIAFLLLVCLPLAAEAQSAGGWLVHQATAANVFFNTTTIEGTEGLDDNALLFVTPNWNPPGVPGVYFNEDYGVYHTGVAWAIYTESGNPIPLGASFNVYVAGSTDDAFRHIHSAATQTDFKRSYLDHPSLNGNPNALVFVTHNFEPNRVVNDGQPSIVEYDPSVGRWLIHFYIQNDEFTDVPDGAAFNVWVQSPGASSFLHIASAGTLSSNFTRLDHPLLNGNPSATILIDNEWAGSCCINEFGRLGVFYDVFSARWAIFGQDLLNIAPNSRHHVTVPEPGLQAALAWGLAWMGHLLRRRRIAWSLSARKSQRVSCSPVSSLSKATGSMSPWGKTERRAVAKGLLSAKD